MKSEVEILRDYHLVVLRQLSKRRIYASKIYYVLDNRLRVL
jgi:hypothetical protein